MTRNGLRLAAAGAGIVLFAELAIRLLGYGDPPLFILDDRIEYLAKPGNFSRFGNQIQVNQAHMRGPEVGKKPELRILLLGDSIVFGTYRVNQDELISTALAANLKTSLGVTVDVLNAACPSWGPINQLAYIQQHGVYNADWVIWLLSSHDLLDVPVTGYADQLPLRSPAFALEDAAWLLRRRLFSGAQPEQAEQLSLKAVSELLEYLASEKTKVLVALHSSVGEVAGGPDPLGLRLSDFFERKETLTLRLGEKLRNGAPQPSSFYLDNLHLNPLGAKAVGSLIAERLLKELAK